MKEETNVDPSAVPDQPDTDLVSLLKTMQQQLVALETKVDLLISRSQEKNFNERSSQDRSFGRRSFSKPFQSRTHPRLHNAGEREHRSRDKDSTPGHFYERRPQEKSRRSNPRNKQFAFKRKDQE